MGEEVKKISFGFSKLAKKTSIVSGKTSEPKTDNKVEYIDCLEGKSIKLKDPIKCENTILVIPLKKESKEVISKEVGSINLADKRSEVECNSNPSCVNNHQLGLNADLPNEDIGVVKKETLDEIAAREILQDLNEKKEQEENHVFSVPLTSNAPIGESESSLEDYDNIPVSQFGLAMLRGMGWAPGKGIGKNEKLVTPSLPALRPKGMGLGADKVLKAAVESGKSTDKDLKMAKGSFVRIIAGVHKDCYGLIEGFDDESGRMIVKLALKNISISLNEFMTQLVDKNEFLKNSKVINMGKYEQYKDDEKKELPEHIKRDEKHRENPTSSFGREHSRSSKSSRITTTKRRSKTPDSPERKQNYSTKYNSKSNKLEEEQYTSSKTRVSRSSSSNRTSGSDSDYSDRKKHRTKKKKPSSHRHKSRTRSRSPKHHKSHKKHKKRK